MPLTNKELESYASQENCRICKKWFEKCEIEYKDCECYLQYTNAKNDLLIYKCFNCNRKFDEDLKKRFTNTYEFCNFDIH